MIAFITDDMVDAIGVSGTPSQVADRLLSRNDFADRTAPVLYNETDPDAVTEIVRRFKSR